ncbi:hypothetical protein MKW98_006585 [Papaver atlanticum]|uniref:Peptidase M48 domain-containing protein n=1 Tax=Papaver atlanticum TaxID=357466 RepID=A0AAD4T9T0_9MAGN|nr:hypothetical protein MKW98_006585 [Papaver atlanticum]
MPGGKIVVFTGLLDRFKSDAEIATILAHEVGHVVARHAAESISHAMWFVILLVLLVQYVDISLLTGSLGKPLGEAYKYLLQLPVSRRNEKEADYIGLLLLASAGYDPRGAPKYSTHPPGKKRAQLLSRDKVLKEALDMYRESNSGRGIEGFLKQENLRHSK